MAEITQATPGNLDYWHDLMRRAHLLGIEESDPAEVEKMLSGIAAAGRRGEGLSPAYTRLLGKMIERMVGAEDPQQVFFPPLNKRRARVTGADVLALELTTCFNASGYSKALETAADMLHVDQRTAQRYAAAARDALQRKRERAIRIVARDIFMRVFGNDTEAAIATAAEWTGFPADRIRNALHADDS